MNRDEHDDPDEDGEGWRFRVAWRATNTLLWGILLLGTAGVGLVVLLLVVWGVVQLAYLAGIGGW